MNVLRETKNPNAATGGNLGIEISGLDIEGTSTGAGQIGIDDDK